MPLFPMCDQRTVGRAATCARLALRSAAAALLAMVFWTGAARAQVAETFNLCQDMAVDHEARLATLADLGFLPANDQNTAILAEAVILNRSLTSDRSVDTPLVPLLKGGAFDAAFPPFPGETSVEVALWHDSGLGVLLERAQAPFLSGKIDLVKRACVIAVTRDYSGDTGLFRISERPKPFETDFASVIAYVGERPSPFARSVRGEQSGTFRSHVIAIDEEASLGPRWQALDQVYYVELTDDRTPEVDE